MKDDGDEIKLQMIFNSGICKYRGRLGGFLPQDILLSVLDAFGNLLLG